MKTLYDKIVEAVKNKDKGYIYKVSGMKVAEANLPVNENGDNLLLWAVKNEEWEIFDRVLQNTELDINIKDKQGSTVLNELVKKLSLSDNTYDKQRCLSYVKNLLNRSDIDINTQDEQGNTPWANILVYNNYENLSAEAFEYLDKLEDVFYAREDLNVNLQNNRGETALLLAAKANRVVTVEKLIAKFADVNIQDNHGYTALIEAVKRQYSTLLSVLLEHEKIDVNIKNENGDTAFSISMNFLLDRDARAKGIANKLLDRDDVDVNIRNDLGAAPLITAYVNKYNDILTIILKKENVDVNIRGTLEETLLMEAGYEGNYKLAQYLLGRGDIDINAFDKDGNTALITTIRRLDENGENGYAVMKAILAHPDLDINASKEGKTTGNALTTAIRKKNDRVIDIILERDDVDIDKPNNYIAFDSAIYTQDLSLLRRLTVNKNFDVEDEDYNGANAIGHTFDCALNSMDKENFDVLISFILDVCKQENISQVINHKDKSGNTAIMTAIKRGAKWSDIELFLSDVITHFGFVNIDFKACNNAGQSLESMLKAQSDAQKETDITRVIKRYNDKCEANGLQPLNNGQESEIE